MPKVAIRFVRYIRLTAAITNIHKLEGQQAAIQRVISILKAKILLSIFMLNTLLIETTTAFHGKTSLVCGECHVAHKSQDSGNRQPDGGLSGHLLIKESSTELCLACHDGKAGVPDVIGEDDANGLMERAAGFFIAANAPGANGHDLQADSAGLPNLCSTCHSGGSFSTAKIGCIDCHDPHGRNSDDPVYSYRNLRSPSEPDDGPLFRAFVKPGVTGLEVYEQRNIGYTAPDTKASDWREVTSICFDCHHIFSRDGYTRSSDGVCIRHPSTDSERNVREPINRHGAPQTDPDHWKSGYGIGFAIGRVPFLVSGAVDYAGARTVVANDIETANEVFCLTCHRAHGSENRNSLRWSENSNLGCQQCHNKG